MLHTFFHLGEMMDVCLMCNLIQVIRHASQRAKQRSFLFGYGFLDITIDSQLVNQRGERLACTLSFVQQLLVTLFIEIYFDREEPLLTFWFLRATAFVWCLGVHSYKMATWISGIFGF